MHALPSIRVLSADRAGLTCALEMALVGHVKVRHHVDVPPPNVLSEGDVLVLDLDNPPTGFNETRLGSVLCPLNVWLVTGESRVSPRWLSLARRPNVTVVHCDARDRRNGFSAVTAALLRLFQGPTGMEICEMVLAREPVLATLRPLVYALCEQPWEVRRPWQLAAAIGATVASVRREIGTLGFGRVEHFITYVRFVALEEIAARRQLPIAAARRLVGIMDPSNLRRQLRRVRSGLRADLHALSALSGAQTEQHA